jgi:hypothetical protein
VARNPSGSEWFTSWDFLFTSVFAKSMAGCAPSKRKSARLQTASSEIEAMGKEIAFYAGQAGVPITVNQE